MYACVRACRVPLTSSGLRCDVFLHVTRERMRSLQQQLPQLHGALSWFIPVDSCTLSGLTVWWSSSMGKRAEGMHRPTSLFDLALGLFARTGTYIITSGQVSKPAHDRVADSPATRALGFRRPQRAKSSNPCRQHSS